MDFSRTPDLVHAWASGSGMDLVTDLAVPRDQVIRAGWVLWMHPLTYLLVAFPDDSPLERVTRRTEWLVDLALRRIDALADGKPVPAWPS